MLQFDHDSTRKKKKKLLFMVYNDFSLQNLIDFILTFTLLIIAQLLSLTIRFHFAT